MEPLRRMIQLYLRWGSLEWENEQEGQLAAALRAGQGDAERSYVIVECAKQVHEASFKTECMLLMSEACMWMNLLPARDQTLKMRGLVFRMLSSADALIQESLGLQHSTAPIKVFGILGNPSVAAEVEGLPPCLLDPWSRRFVEQHKGDEGGLLGSVPMAKLRLLARLAKVDISAVEAMHATIRRRVFSRFQTHSQTLSEVSSEWVCGRLRRTGKPRDLEVLRSLLLELRPQLQLARATSLPPRGPAVVVHGEHSCESEALGIIPMTLHRPRLTCRGSTRR